jgi:tetratricopeptide (TPR) repeat protein
MTIMADVLLQAGDARRALQRAREAFDIATATDDRACAGWAMRAQGQALSALGELSGARERLDDAVVVFETLRARIDIAKTLVERAELDLKEGHPAHARQDLRRAHALFNECGVKACLARVAQLEERCERAHTPAHLGS